MPAVELKVRRRTIVKKVVEVIEYRALEAAPCQTCRTSRLEREGIPQSPHRAEPPEVQEVRPKSKARTLAARLVDPARRPAVVEEEARELSVNNLRKMLKHVERLCQRDSAVLNPEQRGVKEALQERLTFLEGDEPGGES